MRLSAMVLSKLQLSTVGILAKKTELKSVIILEKTGIDGILKDLLFGNIKQEFTVGGSFEEKLIAASSAETLKSAKLLLKQGRLAGAFREPDGGIKAIFNENKSYCRVKVTPGDNPSMICDCDFDGDGLCPHAVAAIMYNANFASRRPAGVEDKMGSYAGMKQESLKELLSRVPSSPGAQVFIKAESEFPHVPSKWENAVLSVKLKNSQREYVGSLNNLRKLYFDKVLALTLKLEDFSLQDRQIIQFLAVHAESENSQLLMNSEVTAEFFHCLGGFNRFSRGGRRLIIHNIPARAAILHIKNKDDDYYTPGIIYEGAALPVNSAKVIVGRSGCWVGRDGEYFFIPASIEINWLRNFFRLGEQRIGDTALYRLLENDSAIVPVVELDSGELKNEVATTVISGRRGDSGELFLKLQYFYQDVLLPADGGRLAWRSGKFFQRDELGEFNIENALRMMRCAEEGEEFKLDDPEVQGMFLDEMLPAMLHAGRRLMVSDTVLQLSGNHLGIQPLEFRCKVLSKGTNGFKVGYKLLAGSEQLPLNDAIKLAKKKRRYFRLPGGGLAKITPELSKLLCGLENIVSRVNDREGCFELPMHQLHFYRYLADGLPFAVPPELSQCGVDAIPEEVERSLEVPFKLNGELRNYQEEGVRWMYNMALRHFNFILADEMGLGKTIQLLALLTRMRSKSDPPALVICPASLVANWVRECNRFVPEFKAVGVSGGERDFLYEKGMDFDFIAMSYATARHDIERLKKLKFSFLVLDEAQHIKNAGTVNAQSCKAIQAEHRVVLTGTPLENSPEDLWSLFEFLHPGFLGAFNNFRQRYCNIRTDEKLQNELAARVAPFIKRRLKSDVCKELPPKIEKQLYCEMDDGQYELYENYRKYGLKQLRELRGKPKEMPFEILTTLLRLRQICCHPPLLGEEGSEASSAKMELARELITGLIASGSRILFFSQFTSLLAYIRDWLTEEGIKFEYLDGATKNRQQRVDNFNNSSDIPIFLLSLKAGGTGLNLTSADSVIIYDPWWNPAVEDQASDRTHRIGQTRTVTTYKLLVKDSIEERIMAMKRQKQEVFERVIDHPELASEKLSLKELEYLFAD